MKKISTAEVGQRTLVKHLGFWSDGVGSLSNTVVMCLGEQFIQTRRQILEFALLSAVSLSGHAEFQYFKDAIGDVVRDHLSNGLQDNIDEHRNECATTVSTTTIKTASTVVVNWNTCAIDRVSTNGKPLSLPTKKGESHVFGATSKCILSHNVTQNTTLRRLSLLVSAEFTLSRPSINQKTHTFMDTIDDQIALRTCVKLL